MVKNTTGGSKTKGQARKFVNSKASNTLRISEDESEVYAQVIKLLGGSMCHVNDAEGKTMLCHIRGKFRGRGKRDNFVGNGTWVLVGLREWEKSDKESTKKKLENCDLLEVYNEYDKERLRNTVTTVNWALFVSNDTKTAHDGDDTGIEFSDEKTDEYKELVEAQIQQNNLGKSTSILADDEEVDIEDI
jgi:translation initiation factor IF-1